MRQFIETTYSTFKVVSNDLYGYIPRRFLFASRLHCKDIYIALTDFREGRMPPKRHFLSSDFVRIDCGDSHCITGCESVKKSRVPIFSKNGIFFV